jgi:hypothetical protein
MLLVVDGVEAAAALKLLTLEVAWFMLFAKVIMATLAAITSAMPTPVSMRNVP